MKLAIFPTVVGIIVLASWLTVTLVDSCILQNTDPKFGCSSSLQIVAAIATIAATLTAVAAGHALEDQIVAVLQRQVQMRHEAAVATDHLQQRFIHLDGIDR